MRPLSLPPGPRRRLERTDLTTSSASRRLTKRKYLRAELGEGTVALMRTVKRALDPLNLLNPGKVLFSEGEEEWM